MGVSTVTCYKYNKTIIEDGTFSTNSRCFIIFERKGPGAQSHRAAGTVVSWAHNGRIHIRVSKLLKRIRRRAAEGTQFSIEITFSGKSTRALSRVS